MERIGPGAYFDAISDGSNVTRSRPDPEVLAKAAEMLSLDPSVSLVAEDAHAGVEAVVAGV